MRAVTYILWRPCMGIDSAAHDCCRAKAAMAALHTTMHLCSCTMIGTAVLLHRLPCPAPELVAHRGALAQVGCSEGLVAGVCVRIHQGLCCARGQVVAD